MLALSLVEEIDRLLKEGTASQRAIAARLGVSRGTVAAIANGRRGMHGRDPDLDYCDSLAHSTPPARCPECGFLVYMPCLVCRAREFHQLRKRMRAAKVRPAAARLLPSSRRSLAEAGVRPGRARVA